MLSFLAVVLAAGPSGVSTSGACPTFHCTPEATGAMALSLERRPHRVAWQVADAGSLSGQGCGGDGTSLACVFTSTTTGTGTLRVFDPATGTTRWTSAAAQELSPRAGTGQVPVLLEDGSVLASDDVRVVWYEPTGAVRGQVALSGADGQASFGVIPLTDTSAFVHQRNGVVGLLSLEGGTLRLVDSTTLRGASAPLNLASPASATGTRGYFVGSEGRSGQASLHAVDFVNGAITPAWPLPLVGTPEASPVVLATSMTGRSRTAVLVHEPGAGRGDNRLVLVEDRGTSGERLVTVQLTQRLGVAPLIDPIRRLVFLQFTSQKELHVISLDALFARSGTVTLSSVEQPVIDVSALAPPGVNWSRLSLNGHVVGSFTPTQQLVLLSGKTSAGQWAIGLDASARTLSWSTLVSATSDSYTAAWTIQRNTNGNCPIVVGTKTGITMLCP